jgi:hypothetical protein
MSLKILLGKFVAFFARQIPVQGHKNIIDSFTEFFLPRREKLSEGKGKTKTYENNLLSTEQGTSQEPV